MICCLSYTIWNAKYDGIKMNCLLLENLKIGKGVPEKYREMFSN
jgi:vancomycin permeability regulator SanA